MGTRTQTPSAPHKKTKASLTRGPGRAVPARFRETVIGQGERFSVAPEPLPSDTQPPSVAPNRAPCLIKPDQLNALISALLRDGYQVIGPSVRDGAVTYGPVNSICDLPSGWTEEQEAGRYWLNKNETQAIFGYSLGVQSWKKFLHPAEVRLWAAERQNGTFHILNNDATATKPRAFLGVRACELAAIAVQDRVLLGDKYRDPIYAGQRDNTFIVAVQCTHSAPTCFCASLQAGPKVTGGFDLLLTEIAEPASHRFLIEAGSPRGADLLAKLKSAPAPSADIEAAEAAVTTASQQQRRIETPGLKEFLYANFEHPQWDKIAARCLSCANCTMVCPTCFCTTVEDATDVTGTHAERWRRWDSCFTLNFSHIHGGSIRSSAKSRYRQWMTHKLAAWSDQFGSLGCVGCGRCITWCPAAIDITEEVRAMREGGTRADT